MKQITIILLALLAPIFMSAQKVYSFGENCYPSDYSNSGRVFKGSPDCIVPWSDTRLVDETLIERKVSYQLMVISSLQGAPVGSCAVSDPLSDPSLSGKQIVIVCFDYVEQWGEEYTELMLKDMLLKGDICGYKKVIFEFDLGELANYKKSIYNYKN